MTAAPMGPMTRATGTKTLVEDGGIMSSPAPVSP